MGFFDRLKEGLKKTKENLGNQINEVFSTFRVVDENLLEELEEKLIISDISMDTTEIIINELRKAIKNKNIKEVEEVKKELFEIIKNILSNESEEINVNTDKTKIYLVIGVNGAGKTTSIGKIANKYIKQGKKVLIVPADTFRAAAVMQLEVWAERANADFSDAKEGEDPSSVVYRALESAKKQKYDIILIDTAGRLHNKKNLMNELAKINKTIDKVFGEAEKETLLVLDGTTGQNGLEQAKAFSEVTDITGYVLTKLDGTSKGGIIISIVSNMKKPIKFIGVGEKIDDMQDFNPEEFINAILY
ncbi:MAG: signal recognition particle-docking protein FtsY [Clostridiales bacterium]|nr:signal recognition particle-docking protein FtsY [Clostridiales bacterium]